MYVFFEKPFRENFNHIQYTVFKGLTLIKIEGVIRMKSSKPCSLKYFDGKKMLHGTAALLKISSEIGGPDAFIHDIATKAVKVAIEEYNRPNLKAVK